MDEVHGGTAGAIHMNASFPKSYFDKLGLVSLLNQHEQFRMYYHEPPYTEPYVRWCGRTAGVIPPPTRL